MDEGDSDNDSDFGSPLFGNIADKKAIEKLAVMTLSSPESPEVKKKEPSNKKKPKLSIQIDDKENDNSVNFKFF